MTSSTLQQQDFVHHCSNTILNDYSYSIYNYNTAPAAAWVQYSWLTHLSNIVGHNLNASAIVRVSTKQKQPRHLRGSNGHGLNAASFTSESTQHHRSWLQCDVTIRGSNHPKNITLLAVASTCHHRPWLKCNNNSHGIWKTTAAPAYTGQQQPLLQFNFVGRHIYAMSLSVARM